MDSHNQNQSAVSYPPPYVAPPPTIGYPMKDGDHGYPPPSTGAGPYMAPPPPIGYPTKYGDHGYAQNQIPVETKSRDDGFCKGCCAALCCCCAVDACF